MCNASHCERFLNQHFPGVKGPSEGKIKYPVCSLQVSSRSSADSGAGTRAQVTVHVKDCAKCHATKPALEFYCDKRASDGLQVRHKPFREPCCVILFSEIAYVGGCSS